MIIDNDMDEKRSNKFDMSARALNSVQNTIEIALKSSMKRIKPEKFNQILDLDNITFDQLIKSFDV